MQEIIERYDNFTFVKNLFRCKGNDNLISIVNYVL